MSRRDFIKIAVSARDWGGTCIILVDRQVVRKWELIKGGLRPSKGQTWIGYEEESAIIQITMVIEHMIFHNQKKAGLQDDSLSSLV